MKKAEKAVYILSPITRRVQDEDSDQDRTIVIGFKGTPVFGLEQTEGEPLPAPDPEIDAWVNSLPVIDVSRVWGLSVETFDGKNSRALGSFRPGAGIALGVKNLSTFAHELIHAADHKNGNLKELGQHWRSEIVAELGGAVLLQILGFDHESDLGGCWAYINHYADNAEIDVLDACGKVLQRTCDAVSLILETAEQIKNNSEAVHV